MTNVHADPCHRPEMRKTMSRLRHQFYVETRLRSEEHTSELQSRQYFVCRLLLEKNRPNSDDAYCSTTPPSRQAHSAPGLRVISINLFAALHLVWPVLVCYD